MFNKINKNNTGTGRFISDVSKLVSGKVITQIIAFISIPVIARLYAPDDFGVLGVFIAITAILTAISSLRYNFAIMLPKKDEEAINLVAISVIIITVISLAVLVIVLLFRVKLATHFNMPPLSYYLLLAPIMIFVGGILSVLHYWYSRQKKFGRYAVSGIAGGIAGIIFKLSYVVFLPASPGGLIGAAIFGSSVAILVLLKNDITTIFLSVKQNVSISSLRYWLFRHKNFPLYSSWTALLNSTSAKLPSMMLAFFFTPAVVGFYTLGNRIIKAPADILGKSISNVFYQKLSSKKNSNESIEKVSITLFDRLVALSLFPTIVLALSGNNIVAFVLGSEWIETGVYLQILAPYIFMVFITSPLSKIFYVNEKQKTFLLFGVVLIFIRFIPLVVGGYTGDPRIALMLFSVSNALFYAYKCFWLFSHINYSVSSLIKSNYKSFSYAFFVALIITFLNSLETSVFLLLSGVLLLAVVYYYLIIIRDELLKMIIIPKSN